MQAIREGSRVVLRPVREDDLASVEGWYSEAAQAAYDPLGLEERVRRAGAADGLVAVLRPSGGEPVGLLDYRLGEPETGWLALSFIALAKAYRGWGYGSEAVRLLEVWAGREGIAERFRAEVDARNGLALYFWLRLGYRPLGWHAEGGRDSMAMVRDDSGSDRRPHSEEKR